MEADFFIVGQGLAGSLLAYELIIRNKRVVVFDDPTRSKASDVAAGIINPVVFRRMTKSWLVDDAFPIMEETYQRLELFLNHQLYFPTPLIKILSEDALLQWKNKVFANGLRAYLESEPLFKRPSTAISESFSSGLVKKSGRFDIQTFIFLFHQYLLKQSILIHENFNFNKLLFLPNAVTYDNLSAQKVIFCEGPAVSANPFFKNLQFKHSKGEVLELKMPTLDTNKIISDEIFIMPVGDNCYKVGATYSWDQLDFTPTPAGKAELIGKLQKLTSAEFAVVSHKAGVRPTTHDRKPVVGLLPENSQVGIFNGLGSKGVLLGPYFARQLADFLTGVSNSLRPEADVLRYYKPNKNIK